MGYIQWGLGSFGAPKRRRRKKKDVVSSTIGGGSKLLLNGLTVLTVGGLIVVGFVFLKEGGNIDRTFDEMRRWWHQTDVDLWAKKDEIDRRELATLNAIGESIGNTFCQIQNKVGPLLFGPGFKRPQCSASKISESDRRYFALYSLAGGSPKPVPKMTNNMVRILQSIGVGET